MSAPPPPDPAAEWRAGLVDIVPPLIAAVPVALILGALAAGKGLSVAEVTLFSALVFAGGAQFAALELWTHPAPIAALAFSTLLINARHVLMSASLAGKLGRFRPWQRALAVFVMADETWALAERRALSTPLTPAYWLGLTAIFYANWVAFSTLGALIGRAMGDPARLGADFAFSALFIALIAAFWRGRSTAVTVAASGLAAAAAWALVGPPWHIVAGAFAGIAAAYAAAEPEAGR